MRLDTDIEKAIDEYGSAVWRVCILHLKGSPDAQDIFQETFLAYAQHDESFSSEDHKKAWLIRVSINKCRDYFRTRKKEELGFGSEDNSEECSLSNEPVSCNSYGQPGSQVSEVIDAINGLGDPPRTALYLSLYEGYSAPEIAQMLGVSVNTVYSWIARGKQSLRKVLL